MAEGLAKLDSPIDVMYLIHKALTAEAARVQRLIEDFEIGDSLQPFRGAFNSWATALMYHADIEDQYMTAPMTDFEPARVNEAEHAELGELKKDLVSYMDTGVAEGLEERVRQAIIALHDEQHSELMERLEDVMAVFNEEIGKSRVIARTKRHLYGKVVALRICQDDHLESEEAFVLPEVRDRMSDDDQLELVKRLLVDEEAEAPHWILDSVAKDLTSGERKLLKGLESRFTPVSTVAD